MTLSVVQHIPISYSVCDTRREWGFLRRHDSRLLLWQCMPMPCDLWETTYNSFVLKSSRFGARWLEGLVGFTAYGWKELWILPKCKRDASDCELCTWTATFGSIQYVNDIVDMGTRNPLFSWYCHLPTTCRICGPWCLQLLELLVKNNSTHY